MSIDAPFDRGLQPERTLLAWRRTTLSLGLASAVGLRLTVSELGAGAIIVGAVGVVLSVAAYVLAALRYRRAHGGLTSSGSLPNGGLTMAAVALVSVLLGLLAMVAILSGGFW